MSTIAILSLITLGAGATVGFQQYRKMKKKLPEDTSHIRPEQSLQRMDVAEQLAEGKTPGEVSPRGTKPAQATSA